MFSTIRFLRKIYKILRKVPKPFWVALETILEFFLAEAKKSNDPKKVAKSAENIKKMVEGELKK